MISRRVERQPVLIAHAQQQTDTSTNIVNTATSAAPTKQANKQHREPLSGATASKKQANRTGTRKRRGQSQQEAGKSTHHKLI